MLKKIHEWIKKYERQIPDISIILIPFDDARIGNTANIFMK